MLHVSWWTRPCGHHPDDNLLSLQPQSQSFPSADCGASRTAHWRLWQERGTHKQGLRWGRSLDFVAVQALQMLPLGCQFSWLECSVYTSGRGCLAIRGFGIKQSISCQIRRMDSCSFLFESSLCAPAMAESGREQH